MICPNCQHNAQGNGSDRMPGVCPACGIAYDKWRQRRQQQEQEPLKEPVYEDTVIEYETFSLFKRLYHYTCFVPSDRDESAFWGHSVLFVLFFVWGWKFILGGIDWISINNSFLHRPDLIFHEFGHVMFSPFGRFITILGGSLFQIILPLGIMLAFMIKQRDNFSASIMLWWCGQNFIDVSPYIADAQTRVIPLIGNLGVESHDWGNLLRMTGTLEHTISFAWTCFGIGTFFIIFSQLWGGYLLYIELVGRTRVPDYEKDKHETLDSRTKENS